MGEFKVININTYCSEQSEIDRLKARFDKFTLRDPITNCLLWTAYKDSKGYGVMWVGYARKGNLTKMKTHRVAWILGGNDITDDKPFILHNCPNGDNPLCCEITHLWSGTDLDNNQDRSVKDRSRRSKRGLPRGVQPNREGEGCTYQARAQIGSYQKYLGSYKTVEEAFAVASAAQKLIDQDRTPEIMKKR